jgi:hypothetical protein
VFETRNARQIERRVHIAEAAFEKGIQEAIDLLEPSEPRVRMIENLSELHEALPVYIDEFLHLAESGEWEVLEEELRQQARDKVVDLEELQEQQVLPELLLRALRQVRDDVVAMRKLLSQIVEQRDAAQFEPLLREMEEVTRTDIEDVLNIIVPPPSTEIALTVLHDVREGLHEQLEGAVRLAWEEDWDTLENEWEPAWQEIAGYIETMLQEIEHSIH